MTSATARELAQGERLRPVPALSGLRSLLRYSGRPLARFEAARALSDRAVAFDVLGWRYIVFFDLRAIEHVLVTEPAAFHKDEFTRDLRRVLGTGLLTSEGEPWRRHRKLLAPSFQRQEIAGYAKVMVERAEAFAAEHVGKVLDVHAALMHLTLDILVRALFGTEVPHAAEVARLLEQLMADYLPSVEVWRITLPDWFPVPSRGRLARIGRQLDAILLELMAERRRAPRAGAPSASQPQDLLGRLMSANDAEGKLSEAAVRDEAMTLFLAGHETTALAVTYALHLLARHPREADLVAGELARVLGGRSPAIDDLPALPHTRAVLDEAMRLYPPAWAMGRQPVEDSVVAGIHVPKGAQIILCNWVMHRDARFFPDPERFWPERWLEAPPPPRFAYLPFGAGPRVCIGSHFALAEASLILATVLQRARVELDGPAQLELMPAVTLRPVGPVRLRLVPRDR
jgi:cytochrome P450